METLSLISASITLFLVMDPLGNIPIFINILQRFEKKQRRIILIREMIIALVILLLFLFSGKYILAGMGITQPALNISGGIILFLIALRMIFPVKDPAQDSFLQDEPFIVPLAVPLIAGPSAMATVILLSTREPAKISIWFLSLLIAWAVSSLLLIFSEFLFSFLGKRLITALERLLGMILTTVAVQMFLRGIEEFIRAIFQ